jgi:hypothetical protein
MAYLMTFAEKTLRPFQRPESANTELCEVIITSTRRLTPGFYHFEELFDIDDSIQWERSIIDNGRGFRFLLVVLALPEQIGTSSWTTVEAISQLQHQLSSQECCCTTFMYDRFNHDGENAITRLVSILPLDSLGASSAVMTPAEKESLDMVEHAPQLLQGQIGRGLAHVKGSAHLKAAAFLAVVTLAVLVILLLGARLISSSSGSSSYQRYDTTGSFGPKYQIQFSYSNVSDWARSHPHKDSRVESYTAATLERILTKQ